jgi:hypothetical protein
MVVSIEGKRYIEPPGSCGFAGLDCGRPDITRESLRLRAEFTLVAAVAG